jgi:adenosylcobinamide kinase / adenosylcobinamide-phosphate guanylyltransferase
MAFVLLLGGARSGKSAMAVRLAADSRAPVTFIATAQAGDQEMDMRIRRHRETRQAEWRTAEAPIDVLGAVRAAAAGDFVVLDCLTLWVSNLIGQGASASDIESIANAIALELRGRDCVVVSNEVGLGIVPANELARSFRDILGAVNTSFAAAADRAVLMVAGRALDLTSLENLLRTR